MEYVFTLDSGVTCIDIHPKYHALVAVGCYDGTVRVIDLRKKDNKHIFISDNKVKHNDPVWGVQWQGSSQVEAAGAVSLPKSAIAGSATAESSGDLCFYSISSDGKVNSWVVTKTELRCEPVMALMQTNNGSGSNSQVAASSSGGNANSLTNTTHTFNHTDASSNDGSNGNNNNEENKLSGPAAGCCFAFNPFDMNMYIVGTEDGKIHKCSLDHTGQYLSTYTGHYMAVYSLKWNQYHPRVFLSASADWTVKLWDHSHLSPIMSFDLGTSVNSIAWAPYSSTVFAAVSDEGKVNVYDLHANKYEQLCDQKIVRKARCTNISFSSRSPIILVGDSLGAVASLKLSPNLRKITERPVPVLKKGEAAVEPPGRSEVEIRKLDRLLALSDAKITIVTPIPGVEKLVKKEEASDKGNSDDAEAEIE